MLYDAYGVTGKEFPCLCHVVDATGAVLSPVRSCDTETGEAVRYLTRPDGTFICDSSHPDRYGMVATARWVYPAPLEVRPGRVPEPWPAGRAPFPITTPESLDAS